MKTLELIYFSDPRTVKGSLHERNFHLVNEFIQLSEKELETYQRKKEEMYGYYIPWYYAERKALNIVLQMRKCQGTG